MSATSKCRILSSALLAAIATAGCVSSGGAPRATKPVVNSTDFSRSAVFEKINADELDLLTNAYADRYRTLVEDAVAETLRGNDDPHQRAVAQRMLVTTTSSVYDIATNGDPFTQVLDLTVMVTLTSQVWIDRDRAVREFGEVRAAPLIAALRQAREEIWDIGARVFTQDQLSALDFLIASWRKQNPGVDDVAYVRFDDFNESRGSSIVADAANGGGLFEPIGRAVDQAKNYERLIERMFYLSKRAPTLLEWQTQAAIDEVLAKKEVGDALGNLDSVSKSVDRLANEILQMVTREREALVAEIDKRQQKIDATLGQVKAVVDATAPIVKDVNTLAETGERIVAKVGEITGPAQAPDPNAPPAKPFDVADYQKLLAEATTTLREVNALADKGESLAGSPAVKGLIDQVTDATEERIASVEEAANRVLWKLGIVLSSVAAVVFALAFAYRETGRRTITGRKA